MFKIFITLLDTLKEKELNPEQLQHIEYYIQHLELEKNPFFSHDLSQQKITKFKKHLRKKFGSVFKNQYKTWVFSS